MNPNMNSDINRLTREQFDAIELEVRGFYKKIRHYDVVEIFIREGQNELDSRIIRGDTE